MVGGISEPDLQVLHFCVIISAEFHDLPRFNPEFLVSHALVSGDRPCTRYRRLPRRVEIDFDLIEWVMTERELRIETFPDASWDEAMSSDECRLIPHFAKQFLLSMPLLASPGICFQWELAVTRPDPDQWAQTNFAPRILPDGYEVIEVTTSFVTAKEDIRVRVDVAVEEAGDENGLEERSVTFDCYGTPHFELDWDQVGHEVERWSEYADAVKEVVLALFIGGHEDDIT